ncbi:MAG: hypothetical protein IPJ23_07490 [Ignavibacteriales bacterium]|nr:hypothetical protein [Ignavibacteriales bacterium]
MTKYLILTLTIILASSRISAQLSPETYWMQTDEKSLDKIVSQNPLSNSITDIITIGDTVWLGTSRGVSLSVDGGTNWTNFYGQTDFGTDNNSALAYDFNNRVLWCAGAKSTEVTGGQSLPAGTGLKYTTNNGASWTSIPQPLDAETDTVEQYGINQIRALPVTVTIQNLVYDIAFTPNTIWITTYAGGLRKSTDNGQTWKRVILPPDYLNSISPNDTLSFCLSPVEGNLCSEGNYNHRAFSVISTNDSTLYVGTANGINKSTDGGISWKKFNAQNQQLPISGNFITSLAFNQITNTLWASTWKANGESEFYGVSSTTDGGFSWTTFLRGEEAHNFGFNNNEAMVATDNGMFRTSDNGNTWYLPTAIVDENADVNTKISLPTNQFYSAGSNSSYIWLGSVDGLARLDEISGSMWQGTWKIFFASQSIASINETYCYPNPFNPRQEMLKIKYSTDGNDLNVTIRVFDFGFNYVRTVVQNAPRNRGVDGPPDFWDGKDENGNYVPNGVYFYRVDIGDNDGVYGKILVLQ